MLMTFKKGLAIAAMAGTMMFAAPAVSQDHSRSWETGTVWSVGYVTTKPGMFNAYINDLSQVWRAYLEDSKNDGDVISYQMLSVLSPRDGEPNLILLVEFRDYAVLDRSVEYFEEQAKRLQGSLDESRMSNIERGELRDLNGGFFAQEIHFMDMDDDE